MKINIKCTCGWTLEATGTGQDGMRQSELHDVEACVKAACEAHSKCCTGRYDHLPGIASVPGWTPA